MLETSKDFFYILSGISIFCLAFFLSYFLFYLILILRDVNKITKEAKIILDKLEQLINFIKNQVRTSYNYINIFTEGAKKIMEVLQSSQAKPKKSNIKKK